MTHGEGGIISGEEKFVQVHNVNAHLYNITTQRANPAICSFDAPRRRSGDL